MFLQGMIEMFAMCVRVCVCVWVGGWVGVSACVSM